MNAISTISRRNPYLRANSLEELLSWDDANFIRCAYVTLLGRQPDPDGEAFYLGRIRRGHSKLEVLWQLRRSTEAREHDPGVAGLDRALKRAAWARKPVIGRVVQALYGTEGNSPDERRHRVLLREVRALRRELVVMRNAEPAPPNEHAAHGEPGTATPPAPQRLPREQEKPKQSEARLSKDKCDHDIGLSPLPDSAIAVEDANKVKYIVYAVGHTATCSVNTGVQRVVRQLSKAFLKNGEQLLFVKWNENQRDFELLTTEELDHLSEWSGPTADQILSHGRYQAANGEPVFLGQVDWANMEWIFFPEVHHLGTEDHEVTLNQINAARALKLKTAAIFYDAIPLRRRELKTMAAMHEAYMRQLMEMDLVFPISNAAARDLELFLQSYEGIDRERLPPIRPMLLPAEMPERSRGQAKREHRQTVLCVGSIDERKNQLLLAQAFADLSRENQINGWTLKLVGNCNPELHLQLTEIIDNCPSIEWLGPIPDEALRAVYDDVAFCVFPSIDEGFGLPIAESLWMGKPCICANFGSMAEVAEAGGCLTVDTTDMSSLKLALEQLMLNPKQLKRLQKEVSSADLGTWSDYAAELRRHMDEVAHGAELLGPIYYVAEQTAEFPGNTGIQRVTRGLANALLGIGVPLIAAKWNAGTNGLEPLSADELNHLAKFNGPSVDAWASWEQPGGSVRTRWVLLPELTPHFSPGDYDAMRSFMDRSGLRAAWIFYDTVPWKLKGLYAEGAAIAHSNYMRGLNKFELILAISSHSRDELRKYYVSQPEPTVDLAHRLSACVLPGEFKERPRTSEPASRHKGALRILSVGTIEARKNHITLVRAFLKAKPMFRREARLVLAGSSPFPDVFAPIQELIASSGAVDWIEQPTDDKLDQLYRDCDFTVYPSIEEGFGLPIVESAWYGKPCITANRGAMREAAVGGGCLLVDVSNVDALASALVRLVNSESFRLALAEEACNRPVKTWEDYAKEIVAKLIDDTPPAQPTAHCQSFGVDWQHTFSNLAQRPLLSICITTYNRADWLKRSLGAVLEACAGNEHSVEIVVCDNASTDHTPKVVRDFTGAALLRYHRNARNVGMLGNLLVSSQKARGEYIWIVGDDDLIMPQGVSNVLEALKANPGVSLVYTNYAYTREDDPEKADDLNEFFTTSTPIAEGGESFVGQTKDVALRNENFFTAIYCIVFRRDHGLRAYGQYTGGEPFSSLPTCVPTTNYILKNIMGDQAVWLAEPQLVVNLNVSWMKYAWRWILERFPEIHDTAVRNGADPVQVDRWRTEHLPSMVHFLGDAYSSPEGGRSEFDLQRLILDLKHLERYPEFREDFLRAYSAAALARHPAAKFGLDELFAGYSS